MYYCYSFSTRCARYEEPEFFNVSFHNNAITYYKYVFSLLDITNGAFDDIYDRSVENPVIGLVGVETFVQKQRQFVRKHPKGSGFVHFEIVGELHCLAVGRHQEVGVGRILVRVAERVPATDAVLVHLSVEQGAGVLVQGRPAGLGVGTSGPEHLVLVVAVRGDTGVLHDVRGHAKFPGAGQRVEVQRPVPVVPYRRQGHAEYTVGPLEVHATHVVVAGQRVEVEVMVLDPPGRVCGEAVHHQPVAAQVRDVGKRVVASLPGGVYQDVGEERVGLHVVRFKRVLPDQGVSVQVENHNLGGLQLVGRTPDVVQTGVDQPQSVTMVHVHAEYGYDAIGRVRGQAVLFVVWVRYQIGRSILRFCK